MSEEGFTEIGRVSRKSGGILEVVVTGGQACAKCGLCWRAKDNTMRLELRDDASIEVGQAVRVTLPPHSQWHAIFFVLVLPLLSFLAAVAAAAAVTRALGVGGALQVILTAGAAFGGVVAAFVAARGADCRFRLKVFLNARIEPLDE